MQISQFKKQYKIPHIIELKKNKQNKKTPQG